MKNRLLSIVKILLLMCCGLAAPAAFGQVTQIWTGGVGGVTNNGIDIGYSNNWGGILPSTANGDTGEWNGSVPGDLNLVYDTITMASGYNQNGVSLYMNAAQTSPLTIGTLLTTTPTIAIQNITIDAGAGAFTLGGANTTHRINWVGRPSGAIHSLINNSANTATLTPWIRFTAGGGTQYELDFSGTGNWEVDSYLENDNNSGGTLVAVEGPGTVTWNPVGVLGGDAISSPITVNGGTLILEGAHPRIKTQSFSLNGTFIFAPTNPAVAMTLTGPFSGTGTNRINSGTLTLSSSNSTYSGDTVLAGGRLILDAPEQPGTAGPLGIGTIDFVGGTLVYGVNNTFDYSARFNTGAGQAYTIDTAGQNVTFSNPAGVTGTGNSLTKLGVGSLTLSAASSYTGLTTVSAGKLIFQAAKSGTANITVADNAVLGATAGSQLTPATLTVGTASGAGGILEFNGVNSTTTPLIAAGTVATGGSTITINLNSGNLTPGQSYPLLSWTSGSAPAVVVGIINGYVGNLVTNGSQIALNVTGTSFKWTGNNNGNWDITTPNNWVLGATPVAFTNGAPTFFDDSGILTNLGIVGVVQPAVVSLNIETNAYTITNSTGNEIGGSGGLVKSGDSTLVLTGGANAYTGVTTVRGGILSVGTLTNGGLPSDIGASSSSSNNIILNGGTLQYTGPASSSDRAFSVGLFGGTMDASAFDTNLLVPASLSLTAPVVGYLGSGPRTLTLTGSGVSNVLAAVIADGGGATALLKNGPGSWVLTGTNSYTGLTTINNGVLQIGAGGSSGTIGSGDVVDNRGLDFDNTGTVTVNGSVSGTGSVTNDGSGTVILVGNNTYTGGTAINAGTVQIGNGGATGSLDGNSSVTNNGLLIFDTTGNVVLKQFGSTINGPGNVWVRSTGLIELSSQNTYTGWTLIDAGATLQPSDGNSGQLLSSVVTNNGTLFLTRQDTFVFGYTNNIVGTGRVVKDNNNQNVGDVSIIGTNNTWSGGTIINGGGIIFGDGVTTNSGSFLGGIIFSNTSGSFLNHRFVAFRRPDDFTFSNTIQSFVTDGSLTADQGEVIQLGPDTLTLTGNNSYPGNTTVGGGTLMVGNGGTSGTIGAGNMVLTNNGILVINHSDNVTFNRAVIDGTSAGTGTGTFIQYGTGTTTLSSSNSSLGPTVVSNGTLVVSAAVGGDLDVSGGTLVAGPVSSVTNLTVGGNLNLTNGTLQIGLEPSATPQSNTMVTVNGAINYVGGGIKLVSVGSGLAVGQQFFLFSQPIVGGHLIPVTGQGFTVSNNLESDGSVTVTSVTPIQGSGIKQITLSGTNIVITATNSTGTSGTWTLLSTNKVNAPLSTWPVVGTGSFDNTGSIAITNGVKAGQQFFILRTP